MKMAIAWIAACLCIAATVAHAADWPTREIKWIVPFGPGGGADVVSRIVAAELSKRLGKQVIVENKPGASSVIGTRQIAEATPDGYTIGLLTIVHPVNVAVGQQLPYNVDQDFAFLTQLIQAPMMLIANAKRSFHSVKDLVAYAKANPGKLTAGSIGPATPHHLLLQWLANVAGIQMVIVPFRSIPEALQATISGEVDMMLLGVGGGADKFVENGTLTLLGVTSRTRLADMPNVATIAEQTVPNFIEESWYGLVAPVRTPPDIVKHLGDEVRAVLKDDGVKSRIKAAGAEAKPTSEQEFIDIVHTDTKKYEAIVQSMKKQSN
jgi:tripartite-type tricarboxylate transporter receptor subunit TctC